MPKPSFPQTFADALVVAAKRRGYRAYLPTNLLACGGVAALIVYNLPLELWSSTKRSDLIAIYGALLAFNGLLLAIGWGAFSRIYELIGAGPFSAFLKRHDILKYHILFIEIAQVSLVSASLASGFGVFSTWLPFIVTANRAIMAITIAFTCYALLKTIESTQAMNELLWEAAEFNHEGD